MMQLVYILHLTLIACLALIAGLSMIAGVIFLLLHRVNESPRDNRWLLAASFRGGCRRAHS
ncbi:hypothetical protein N9B73_04755 [Verrucomicrobiales bacterium]|nr:hypothetical protein [Verrucomicrobiales bacterium]